MKNILTIMMFFGLMFTLNAQTAKKNKNAKHDVHVEGVCGMCKKRIESAAFGVKGVKSATWDQNTQQLALIVNERVTDLETVEKAIAAVGHDTENFKAEDKVYDELPGCCKFKEVAPH